MRFKFHQNKVALNEPVKTIREATKQIRYIRRYKSKPAWKNISIAKRGKSYVIVGQLKNITK